MASPGTQLAPQPPPSPSPAPPPAGPAAIPPKAAHGTTGRGEVTIVSLILVAVIGWAGAFAATTTNMWFIVLGAFLVFILFLGRWICGRPLGIFVAQRNLMSLSRFQMVLWTVLILSAYFTMCVHRMRDGAPDALLIGMDWHLWALMGISTTSMVGSPLLLGSKMQKDPHQDEIAKAAAQLNDQKVDDNRVGMLYANPTINDASFADMFQGDEVGNTYYVDVAKLQMFFFTWVSLVVYGAAIFNLLKRGVYSAMPGVSEGLLALLGISHAGYLTSKVTDHTQAAAPAS